MATIGLKSLCPPALLYLVVSLISVIIIAFYNYGNTNVYCVGYYSCPVNNITLIFIVKLIYIVFWTWVLNLICGAGYSIISWLLVLLPILLYFIMIGLLMI